MDDKTICQMEIHPLLIKLHRERTELFEKWKKIYGCNPFANAAYSQWQGQAAQQGFNAILGGLMGNVGAQPASRLPFNNPWDNL